MGLGVVVGMLADLKQNDPDEIDWFVQELGWVNAALSEHGHAPHQEPSGCEIWDGEGIGYSGLHALREVAALLWQENDIPRDVFLDGSQNAAANDHFETCLNTIEAPAPGGFISKLLGQKAAPKEVPAFIHLAAHGDAQGFYVHTDFAVPVASKRTEDDAAHLWPVGSTPRLEQELDLLAKALQMPSELTSVDDELCELTEAPSTNRADPLWKVQPIAAYSCALLRDACRHARKTGAAIVFA